MPIPASVESFGALLGKELPKLRGTGAPRFVPRGGVIFEEGEIGDGLYVVEEGCVTITAKVSGSDSRILARLGPNTFFGEMAVLDDEPRSASAIAEADSRLIFIDREAVLAELKESPAWLTALMREMSQRVRTVDRRYLDEVLQAERLSIVGRFAQSIVHDFKNPLNIIGMGAELAGAEDASLENRQEAKALIRKQVERLTNMINEVLEFTRGAPSSAALVPTDYGQFVEEVLEELRGEMAGRSVTLACDHLPRGICAMVDRTKLLHVFFNLFNNATDFMPDGGTITLRFQATGNEVTTEVEDSGPGISPEIAGRLFQPFATHGKAKGTGLGLSICKRIIEEHRGTIRVRSEPGAGAIFLFTLPRVPQA